MTDLSTSCGPKKLRAFGVASKNTEDEAVEEAAKTARARAQKLCHGDCHDRKRCNYLELEASLEFLEFKTEQGVQIFTAKVVTQGQCQCE